MWRCSFLEANDKMCYLSSATGDTPGGKGRYSCKEIGKLQQYTKKTTHKT